MKFKKNLLYLLIFVVIGAIAVSIYFGFRDRWRQDEEMSVEIMEEELQVEDAEKDTEIIEEEKDSQEIEEVVDENYYSSSSADFANYSFSGPDGWILLEEEDGSRVIIKEENITGKTAESILFMVEKMSDFKIGEGPEDIISSYMQYSEDPVVEAEPIETATTDINGSAAEIKGYQYNSLTAPESIEVDLMTYFEDGEYIYLMKYMGSNISREQAVDTFKQVLSSFSLIEGTETVKVEDQADSMNILILGVDSGMGRAWGRNSARSDINIIVHINLETYESTIVTIPRDMWVSIPGHSDGKINGAHAMGGPELAVQTFEDFTGLDIDNYIISDFDGFRPLIDFLGGVTIEVEENLADGFSGSYLTKGIHHLNGEQALALCRNRHRSGDGSTQGGAWAREKEAAKVIKALYEQKITLEKIMNLPAFANYLLNYTWSDIGFKDILRLLPVMGKIKPNNIEIRGVPSFSKMIGKASAVVHFEEETLLLFEEIKNQ